MKISTFLITLVVLFTAACATKNSESDHGHEHGTEAGQHTHDNDGDHEEQEEFSTDDAGNTTATTTESSTMVASNQADSVIIVVPANKGIEYKFYLKQYEKLTYEWSVETPLYFDFHGEPLDYAKTKYFESYTAGTAQSMKGTTTMPFEGSHGWYWKNNTGKDVAVTLKTKGNYNVIDMKK